MKPTLYDQQGDAIALLDSWIQQRLSDADYRWLKDQIQKTISAQSSKDLYITLGMIPRKLGKRDLDLSDADLSLASQTRAGWYPKFWSITGCARTLVIALLARERNNGFGELYQELCRTADLSENLEFYAALPLLPNDPIVEQQVGEGLRTNMKAVFESIAHHNPYPSEVFDNNRWNHLVLKALFVGSALAPIQGLDERANDELAGILCDYAHERWAAGRSVSCELWRCVGPYARGKRLEDLFSVLESDLEVDRFAAAIALHQSSDREAIRRLGEQQDLYDALLDGRLQWNSLSHVPELANRG